MKRRNTIDYRELIKMADRIPNFTDENAIFFHKTIQDLYNISRSGSELSAKAFSLILESLFLNANNIEFWKFVNDWISTSRHSAEDIVVLRPLIENIWQEFDSTSQYFGENILWHINDMILFAKDALSISRRLDLARTFLAIGRRDVCAAMLNILYQDLSNLDRQVGQSVRHALSNHGFFLSEIANSTDEDDLAKIGQMLLSFDGQ